MGFIIHAQELVMVIPHGAGLTRPWLLDAQVARHSRSNLHLTLKSQPSDHYYKVTRKLWPQREFYPLSGSTKCGKRPVKNSVLNREVSLFQG